MGGMLTFRRKDFSWPDPFLIGFARVCGSIAKKYSAPSSLWFARELFRKQSIWLTNMNMGTVSRSLRVTATRPGSSPSRYRWGGSESMYRSQYQWLSILLGDRCDHCLATIISIVVLRSAS